uniref:Uncharacterized protein n=1 Tax=Cannabis sativa TaxID=3483 RepID=A0A803PRG1_CANSA
MSQFISEITIPESLEFVCLQISAIRFKPKNRRPQTILELNDEKIRDHLVKFSQDETSSLYRRFLQEIIEGRRRYLQEASWPEPSSLIDIPLARPMFLPLVTVTLSPGDLDFEIIAQKAHKSKTPQDPTITFEAELTESKIRSIGSYVGEVLRSCGIKNEQGCRISLPGRKRGAGDFYYLGTHTNDHKIVVRLSNKKEFKDDFFWTTGLFPANTTKFQIIPITRRPVPTPEIEKRHKILLGLPFEL